MTKLSDTQLLILSAASQREDGAVLPLTIDLKGSAVQKILASFERKQLIARIGEPRGDQPPPLRITRAGLEAIGVSRRKQRARRRSSRSPRRRRPARGLLVQIYKKTCGHNSSAKKTSRTGTASLKNR